jgi:hypothetical protein
MNLAHLPKPYDANRQGSIHGRTSRSITLKTSLCPFFCHPKKKRPPGIEAQADVQDLVIEGC